MLYHSRFCTNYPIILWFLSQIVTYQLKRYFRLLLFACFPFTATWAQTPAKDIPFTFGEDLHFEVTYGWVDLAEARLHINNKVIFENSQPYFKIDAFGKTKGAVTIFSKVNDNWGTHLNTQSLLPRLSYRYIEEGMEPFAASIKGVREIGFAVVAMTMTLVAVTLAIEARMAIRSITPYLLATP